jgi:hypothetical protein
MIRYAVDVGATTARTRVPALIAEALDQGRRPVDRPDGGAEVGS